MVIACKQGTSLPFFPVQSQVCAPEDFHIKAFYFLFSICNNILKCRWWNSVSVIMMQGCFHSWLHHYAATDCNSFVCHNIELEIKLKLLLLSAPQTLIRNTAICSPPCPSRNTAPVPWLSGCISPKSWPGWTDPFSFSIQIIPQVGVEWAELEGSSHQTRSKSAMGVPWTVM